MDIFSKLRTKTQQAATTARENYIALLARLDMANVSASDEAALTKLIDALGIDLDRVQSDYQRIQAALVEHDFHVQHDARREVWERAEAAFGKAQEDERAAHEKAKAVRLAAFHAHAEARSNWDRTMAARAELQRLEQDDPQLAAVVANVFASNVNKRTK